MKKRNSRVIASFMAVLLMGLVVLQNIEVHAANTHLVKLVSVSEQNLEVDKRYTINLAVQNIDKNHGKNITFSLKLNNNPMFIYGNDTVNLSEFKSGETQNLSYTLVATKPGDYVATLQIRGKDHLNQSFSVDQDIYFHVKEAKEPVILGEKSIDEPLAAGLKEKFNVKIRKESDENLKNIKIVATPSSESAKYFIVENGVVNNFTFSKLGVGLMPMTVNVKEGTPDGYYTFNFTMTYERSDNPGKELTKKFDVVFEVSGSANKTVEIADIKASKDTIKSGDKVSLSTTIKNTSKDKIKEAIVTITHDSGLIPIKQNKVSVHNLAPGAEKEVVFELQATSDAKTKNYPIGIKVEYDGKTVNQYTGIYVDNNTPTLEITPITVSKDKVKTGEKVILKTTLTNTSTDKIGEVAISLSHDAMIIPISQDKISVHNLGAGETKEISFEVQALEGATTKNYPMGILVEYNGKKVNQYTGLYVENSTKTVSLSDIKISDSSIEVGESTTLTTMLTNSSDELLEEVIVKLSYDEALIPITQDAMSIYDLKPGESKKVTFKVKATEASTSRNYSLTVEATFGEAVVLGNNAVRPSVKQYIGVYVHNARSINGDKSTPRMVVESFTLSKDQIYVGDEFDLKFTVRNASIEKDVENLKVIVGSSDEGKTILPVNQSTSIYVGALGMRETRELTIPYKVLANSEGGVSVLTLNFEYDDTEDKSFKDTEKIFVPIYKKNKITASDVRVGKLLGNAYTLEMDFYNTGKIDIRNLMVDIKGDFETKNSNYYVGDFSTGRMDVYDVQIIGDAPQTISGTILFTYDDTFGEATTIEKEFSITNDQYMEPMDMNEMGNMGEMGNIEGANDMTNVEIPVEKSTSKLPIILGVIALGVVAFFVIRKIRKRKGE